MLRVFSGSVSYVALALAVLSTPVCGADGQGEGKSLPLKKVVLFSSGVGFFEHNGQVEGDAKVDLKFNVDDVNDLLKSMVLQDLGGGRISTVTYGSKDPIIKTLKTFAIDLTTNPTLAQLLDQVRGEKVTLDTPNPMSGTIVGIERRKQAVGDKDVIEVEYLNLLTDEGLRSVPLDKVGKIKLVNEKLDAELRQALTILALGHATDKKTVSLQFLGKGARPVRVGYIQESPIWKTSYRLVLQEKEPPLLQGWAIVENTTEQDWSAVDLTLISGRPISFVMNLYDPLYVSRPVVEPELFASLRPQTYGQDLAARDLEFRRRQADGKESEALARGPAAKAAPTAEKAKQLSRGLDRAGAGFGAGGLLAEDAAPEMDPSQGVQSAAQAGNVGELFQYAIATPVSLPRQQSAMLPIVNDSVKGEKVSIYNPAVHAKHPLNGLKLTNSTGLHLMQGPVTVFDGGAYAGDARIEDLQPGTERLISYAMDLDTEVAPESKSHPEQLVSVKLVKGLLHTSRKLSRAQTYTIKNSGKAAKNVLVEYHYDPNWKLIAPEKPAEKTRDRYRFAVAAKPGEPARLEVQEEQTVAQQISLNNLDDGTINYYMNATVVSEKVKAALAEVIKRKHEIQQVVAQKQALQGQIAIIEQEQNRIRQNMTALDKNSELFRKYEKKFTEQEDQNDKLRDQIKELTATEAKLRKALDDYLLSADIS